MRKTIIALTCLFFTLPVIAEEKISAEYGMTLHDESCVACHIGMTGGDGSTLYTRSDRKVNSRNSLETQVQRCATNTNLPWFEEEVKSVAEYLDKTWYKFSK